MKHWYSLALKNSLLRAQILISSFTFECTVRRLDRNLWSRLYHEIIIMDVL